jgi:transcriptional regulator with XRE-family HTH domain
MSRFERISARAAEAVSYWQKLAAMEFSTGLRSLLVRRGMTQRDLAAALGKSEAYVSRVLNRSENLTLQQMQRLLEPLGAAAHVVVIDRDNVVDWTEKPREPLEAPLLRRVRSTGGAAEDVAEAAAPGAEPASP